LAGVSMFHPAGWSSLLTDLATPLTSDALKTTTCTALGGMVVVVVVVRWCKPVLGLVVGVVVAADPDPDAEVALLGPV
jgi:hypothetical protein